MGVAIGARQVKLTKQQLAQVREQASTDFEDDLAREYRALTQHLPPHAFFEREPEALSDDELRAFFRYFDLSNEQLWLADQGRVRAETVGMWKDGMVENLRLPAFRAAWGQLSPLLGDYYWTKLRQLRNERVEPHGAEGQ